MVYFQVQVTSIKNVVAFLSISPLMLEGQRIKMKYLTSAAPPPMLVLSSSRLMATSLKVVFYRITTIKVEVENILACTPVDEAGHLVGGAEPGLLQLARRVPALQRAGEAVPLRRGEYQRLELLRRHGLGRPGPRHHGPQHLVHHALETGHRPRSILVANVLYQGVLINYHLQSILCTYYYHSYLCTLV